MSEEERKIIRDSNGTSANGLDQESKALFYFIYHISDISLTRLPSSSSLPGSFTFKSLHRSSYHLALSFSFLLSVDLLALLPSTLRSYFATSQMLSFCPHKTSVSPIPTVLNLLMFKVNARISQLLFPIVPTIFIRIWGSLFLHYFLTHHFSQVPSSLENKVN